MKPTPSNGSLDLYYELGDWQSEKTFVDKYMNNHVFDIKTYQKYEDRYNCSGLCRPGLFYFSNPVVYGPPKDTCLKRLIYHVQQDAGPFASICQVTGVVTLIVTLLQFCLFHRPLPESEDDPNY